jgi:hypothetical protein
VLFVFLQDAVNVVFGDTFLYHPTADFLLECFKSLPSGGSFLVVGSVVGSHTAVR